LGDFLAASRAGPTTKGAEPPPPIDGKNLAEQFAPQPGQVHKCLGKSAAEGGQCEFRNQLKLGHMRVTHVSVQFVNLCCHLFNFELNYNFS